MRFCDLILPNDHCQHYVVAGAVFSLSTNSGAVHAAMGESFARMAEQVPIPDVSIRLLVDASFQNRPPWPKPYFRGLSHLVFAGFDAESEVLIDLRTQRVIGRLSPPMAADQTYLRRVVFPAIFGIISETVRITPLHCGCVARNAGALLLAGNSGSGKSSLSLALAQAGLAFISDDWTYVSRRDGCLHAWSITSSAKLLPDAVRYFPELARIDPIISLNGEFAYEMEPEHILKVRRYPRAEPRCLIFLQRQANEAFNLIGMSSAEAATRLEQCLEELPASIWGARDFLVETIRILAQLPCWELRFGIETPQVIAQRLLRFLDSDANADSTRMQKGHAS